MLNDFSKCEYPIWMSYPSEFSLKSRILIIGTSGSGKSTLARQISKSLSIPDIELDALFWKSNWSKSDPLEFRRKVIGAIEETDAFVIHGNYNSIRDLTWGNVDTAIWLDYSKTLVMWRVFKRSVLRIVKNESLWEGNKETIKKTFFSKDSIILWSWNTYDLRKKQYRDLIESKMYPDVKVIRLKSPEQAIGLIRSIEAARESEERK